jgi:uncharacterized protein
MASSKRLGARSEPEASVASRPVARGLAVLIAAAGLLAAAPRATADASEPVAFARRDLEFPCGALRCAGWLYLPQTRTPAPVVVMAHGFAGTRELWLPRYAERFAARGLAVFVFDYRSFGASQGEPRQVIRVEDQLADWSAALAFVRALPEVDGGRMALWGTSFSGGHVLSTAAEHPELRAVVAQVPFVDGEAGERAPLGYRMRAGAAILRDQTRDLFGLSPHYIPVIGADGAFSAIASSEATEAFRTLVPPELGWRNELAARSLLEVGAYRPTLRAKDVRCPLLLVAARGDELIPLASIEAVAAQATQARLVVVEGGHFGPYASPLFEQVADAETAFLVEALEAR